ncbi:MAG: aromatic aminobenezylarsenical efflux permease ArsG family transporter [Thermoanaerobaculia bacterium]
MTPEIAPAVATALWLGVLTSISPCPLATNIAAISYIARRVDRPRVVLLSAFSYSLGRALAYAAVSAVVVLGLLSVPGVSQFLQRYMNKLLGPLLVLVGMYLLGLLSAGLTTTAGSDELRKKAVEGGVLGALLLGALFALSFCPVSAALFFGSLVPLSLQHGSKVLLPVVYGLGTALPVVLLALVATGGTKALGVVMKKVGTFEVWARRITGVVFVAVGVYLSVKFVFLS